MTLALAGKTGKRKTVLAIAAVVAVVVSASLGLWWRSNQSASAAGSPITMTASSGTWTNIQGTPDGLIGVGTQQINWGTSTGSGQSGYRFDGAGTGTHNLNDVFLVGEFTHINKPITGGSITGARLNVTLPVTSPFATNAAVSYGFVHDETPNGADPCENKQPNGSGLNVNGCADSATIVNSPADQTFPVGEDLYILKMNGFERIESGTCPATPSGTETLEFWTVENQNNYGCLYAHFEWVGPAVTILKTAVASPVDAGQDIAFDVTVKNGGTYAATGYEVRDILPGGYSWTKTSGDADCTVVTGEIACDFTSIAVGETKTVRVTGTPKNAAFCGTVPNTATLSKADRADETSTASVTVNCPPKGFIEVYKVVTNVDDDPQQFDANIDGGSSFTFSEGAFSAGHQVDTGPHTVTEAAEPGYTTLGWAPGVGGGNPVCPAGPTSSAGDNSAEINVAGNNTTLVCFYNEQQNREITVCKVVDDNGVAPLNDGAIFGFDVRVHGQAAFFQASLPAYENDATPCVTVNLRAYKIAQDANIEVVEWGPPAGWVNAAGYPHSSLGTNETAVLGSTNDKVTFYNKRATRDIDVCKGVAENGDTTVDGGTFTFDVRYGGETTPYTKQSTFTITASEGADPTCTTVTVPAGMNVEIVEWMGAAGRPANWNGDEAGYPKYQVGDGATVAGETALLSPTDASVLFVNRTIGRTGTLTVNKAVVPQPGIIEDGTFNLLVNGAPKATNIADGGSTGAMTLPTGTYTVSESQGSTSGEPISSYSQAITCVDAAGAKVANPVVLGSGDDVTCTVTNLRNPVASAPEIIVRKFSDPAGNMTGTGGLLGGWPITIDGTSGPATGKHYTEYTGTSGANLGVAFFGGIEEGTWTVSEPSSTAGWKVVGSKLNSVAPDADNVRDGGQSVTAHNGSSPVVDFYNQPRVNIVANKVEITDGVSAAGQGWKLTLSGCGMTPDTRTTAGVNGTATWSDLPPCATYVVSEDPNSKPGFGFFPVTSITSTLNATAAGQTYSVTFTNQRITFIPPLIVVTPTPTVAPPTATVAPPTATVQPPTATATVTEITLGEKTPGPTPIVPETGSGAAGSGMPIALLVVAGLLLATGSLSTLALVSRRRRG